MTTPNTSLACSLLLKTIFLLENTVQSPNIDINPTQIYLGLTSSLEVNCSFSVLQQQNVTGLLSLIVSRENDSEHGLVELAAINQHSEDNVVLMTSEDATASSFFSPDGNSYLHLRWAFPSHSQAGTYKCSVQGLDRIGHVMVIVKAAEVTASQPGIDAYTDKLRQMDLLMSTFKDMLSERDSSMMTLERKMSQMEAYMDSCNKHMSEFSILSRDLEQRLPKVERQLQPLQQLTQNFDKILAHKNRTYYISKEPYYNIEFSVTNCALLGGHVAEMNDEDEYRMILAALGTVTGVNEVIIGGTDEGEEGSWVLPTTNQALPYVNWKSSQPNGGTSENCLVLCAPPSWELCDQNCLFTSPNIKYRYMCELQSN